MGKSKTYGTTWWGQKWLDSLTDIDFSNRIPRGKTYANTGKVTDVEILYDKGMIKAKVKGNCSPFYRVTLTFQRVTESERKAFVNEVNKDMSIVSKLTDRKLDPSLMDIAERCHIKLFPRSWQDIGMKCNCPDFAVPCKHIAAVIYVVSEVIDSNPFIIFSLKGIDLLKAVEESGVNLNDVTKVETASIADLSKSSLTSMSNICKMAMQYEIPLEPVIVERTVPLNWKPDFKPGSCYDPSTQIDLNQLSSEVALEAKNLAAQDQLEDIANRSLSDMGALSNSDVIEYETLPSVQNPRFLSIVSQAIAAVDVSATTSAGSRTESKVLSASKSSQSGAVTQSATSRATQDISNMAGLQRFVQAIERIQESDYEIAHAKKKPGRKSKSEAEKANRFKEWSRLYGSVNIGLSFNEIKAQTGVSLFQDEQFIMVYVPDFVNRISTLRATRVAQSQDQAKKAATPSGSLSKAAQSLELKKAPRIQPTTRAKELTKPLFADEPKPRRRRTNLKKK